MSRRSSKKVVADEGQTLLGWRDVPVDNSCLGERVKPTEPVHRQVFIGRGTERRRRGGVRAPALHPAQGRSPARIYDACDDARDERTSTSSRCRAARSSTRACSWPTSSAPITRTSPIRASRSALALVHQRFSTNTFPSWRLAHPYRMVAHNGEINTVRGNVNWMAARQASVDSELFGNDISKLWPISYEGQSDTACFDNALEFLVQGGYSLSPCDDDADPGSLGRQPADGSRSARAFYEYHAALMEPWDGPAAVAFTDGRQIGATLDRNGLRPARYIVTNDGLVIMASEAGVLPMPEERIVTEVAPAAGQDAARSTSSRAASSPTTRSRPSSPPRILTRMAEAHADRARGPDAGRAARAAHGCHRCSIASRRSATRQEDLKLLLPPMAATGQEAVGSMGTDTPISAMSTSRSCSTPISSRISRRSPIRRSTRSARNWS